MIDLRSDTVTLQDSSVMDAMRVAKVGDAAYGEDGSYNDLLLYCQQLFKVEDGLFVTSGSMANRLALASQTTPGDEVITHYNYHVHFFDSAGNAKINGIVWNCIQNSSGILDTTAVEKAIDTKPRYKHFAQVKLVSIENSINGFNGKIYPFDLQVQLYQWLQAQGIHLHLDGARIWNAHIEAAIPLSDYANYTDTLSCSFSKGLGGPFGAMLLGKKEIIERARKLQLWLGGGYHQIGYYAHAAKYVLMHHIPRLRQDHQLAKLLADKIQEIPYIQLIDPYPETNIVAFGIKDLGVSNTIFLEACQSHGLLLFPWLKARIRAVTHLGIDQTDIMQAVDIIKRVVCQLMNQSK